MAQSALGESARPRLVRAAAVTIGVLITIVIVAVIVRVVVDWPSILADTVPDDEYAKRFVAHPWLSYLHIAPGVVYLLGAPLQLTQRFRTRHYDVHRRLGRALLTCGLISGVFALAFGLPYPWGGTLEATATAVFGSWFLLCLALAFRAIRRDDVRQHRRWMIRAFAVGVGIGTIRIWIGIFTSFQQAASGGTAEPMPDPGTFGLSFWLAFTMHVVIAEWWLRRTPALTG